MDTQQIEIIGRGLLTAHLIEGGVEVARPERDRGVDLIAYVDTLPGGFAACPIQMKAFTDRAFAIWRKYDKTCPHPSGAPRSSRRPSAAWDQV